MKKRTLTYLTDVKKFTKAQSSRFYSIVKKSNSYLLTYNQIMKFMEDKENHMKIYAILICLEDIPNEYIFQHLPLFCEYFSIRLFTLPKGSRKVIENILDRKFIVVIAIKNSDCILDEFKMILSDINNEA